MAAPGDRISGRAAGDDALRMVGWREWLAIPAWGITRIKTKVDTGARTSSLHAEHLHFFHDEAGREMVRFKVHPHQRSLRRVVAVTTEVADKRVVRSSNGEEELRPVVLAHVELHGVCWPIELTLARRRLMGFRMLLGREALWHRFTVNPAESYLGGMPTAAPRKAADGEGQAREAQENAGQQPH